MKEKVIIFGASKLGKMSHIFYEDIYNILCFCDNDKSKIGHAVNNKEIISPAELGKYGNIKIIIASRYYHEISEQLSQIGITNFIKSEVFIEAEKDILRELDIESIDLGDFLQKEESWEINNLAFIHGGSGILDYAFLKSLIVNLNLSIYLEIGSFLGESIDAIADVAQKCYSISLPNETLNEFFKCKKKDNFGGYFAYNKENVISFKENSQSFDFKSIKDNVDLVFIDGDHSYQGIYNDTINIMNLIDTDNTLVVWHDFKIGDYYRFDTIRAVYDAVPQKLHSQIYAVDNNMCGIYIPLKYKGEFKFKNERDMLYSYKTTIQPQKNYIEIN